MDAKHIEIARKTEITEAEWEELVKYSGGHRIALACRIFYLTVRHSTHTFDYLVPDRGPNYSHPQVTSYLLRVDRLLKILRKVVKREDVYYFAANLAGSFNRHDPKIF